MGIKKKQENIVGTRQGIFDVMYECDYKSNDGHRMFHIKCSKCGWETNMQMHYIKYTIVCNHVDLCGNYVSDYRWKNARIGRIYKGIKKRCYNQNDKSYRWYGGKGIKLCEECAKNPDSFEEWSLTHGYQNNLTIDRLESDKDYCPENCRWLPLNKNTQRAGKVNWLEVNGDKKTGREWGMFLGLGSMTINKYLRDYPEEKVKEFIVAATDNPLPIQNHQRKSHQTWFDVYGIET